MRIKSAKYSVYRHIYVCFIFKYLIQPSLIVVFVPDVPCYFGLSFRIECSLRTVKFTYLMKVMTVSNIRYCETINQVIERV